MAYQIDRPNDPIELRRHPARTARAAGTLVAALVLAMAAGACKGPDYARLGDVYLAQADGVLEAPPESAERPTVQVLPDVPATLPATPGVRLAIDREVPWHVVRKLLEQAETAGQEVTLLVGKRRDIHGFRLEDPVDGPAVRVSATSKGMSCVSPPGVSDGKCSKSRNIKTPYIDVVSTRELVREAVRGYGLDQVQVDVIGSLPWADVVRAIDASRTCCFEKPIAVGLYRRPPPSKHKSVKASANDGESGQDEPDGPADSDGAGDAGDHVADGTNVN